MVGFYGSGFLVGVWYFGGMDVPIWSTYDFPPRADRAAVAKKGEDLDLVSFARIRLGFSPDKQQLKVLKSSAKRGILNCSRQWGKSTVTAAKAVHRAYTRAGSLVLIASPSERQSAEFLNKASSMVRTLGVPVRGDGKNAVSLLFPNGSRIVGLRRRLPGVEDTDSGVFRRRRWTCDR